MDRKIKKIICKYNLIWYSDGKTSGNQQKISSVDTVSNSNQFSSTVKAEASDGLNSVSAEFGMVVTNASSSTKTEETFMQCVIGNP